MTLDIYKDRRKMVQHFAMEAGWILDPAQEIELGYCLDAPDLIPSGGSAAYFTLKPINLAVIMRE